MDRPAQIMLQFDSQAYSFWEGIINKADTKSVYPLSDGGAVVLAVKHFDLSDHQFVHVKITVDKGKELELWIPRSFLKAVVQGKSDLSDAFSFRGKTKK